MALQRLFAGLLTACLAGHLFAHQGSEHIRDQIHKLRSDLLDKARYDPWVKPAGNDTYAIPVDIHLQLLQAPTLDPGKHLFEVAAILCMSWKDEHLAWDPSQYGGLDRLSLNNDEAWGPRLVEMNQRIARDGGVTRAKLLVSPDGNVQHCISSPIRATCITDLSDFPFDKHECRVLYSGESDARAGSCKVSTSPDKLNAEFEVVNSTAGPLLIQSELGHYYEVIQFKFALERRNQRHRYTIIVPAVSAYIIALLAFWLPPGSNSKITLAGVSLFLAVLLIHTSAEVVSGSTQVPKIVKALGALSLVDSIVLLSAVISMNMTKRSAFSTYRPPRFVVNLSEGLLGRLLCMCPPPFWENETRAGKAGFEANKEWYFAAQALDRFLFVVLLLAFVGILC